jgi:HAE1 family hydrophobic/amphiphilic exporter-1
MKVVNKMHMPEEITIIPEGDMKYQTEAFGSLGIAFLASILFVYLIMVALYNSYMDPFVVLFSIPLAIIGALLALGLTMQSLTIFSILGMIMLVGLVGKNAILLVDFTNQMKAEGHNTRDALILAGKVRMRPILMTTFSMIFGMMPIALASGAGSEWKNGMAWALIGGLTSSLLLTLIVVPVVYYIFDRIKVRSTRKKEIVPVTVPI